MPGIEAIHRRPPPGHRMRSVRRWVATPFVKRMPQEVLDRMGPLTQALVVNPSRVPRGAQAFADRIDAAVDHATPGESLEEGLRLPMVAQNARGCTWHAPMPELPAALRALPRTESGEDAFIKAQINYGTDHGFIALILEGLQLIHRLEADGSPTPGHQANRAGHVQGGEWVEIDADDVWQVMDAVFASNPAFTQRDRRSSLGDAFRLAVWGQIDQGAEPLSVDVGRKVVLFRPSNGLNTQVPLHLDVTREQGLLVDLPITTIKLSRMFDPPEGQLAGGGRLLQELVITRNQDGTVRDMRRSSQASVDSDVAMTLGDLASILEKALDPEQEPPPRPPRFIRDLLYVNNLVTGPDMAFFDALVNGPITAADLLTRHHPL